MDGHVPAPPGVRLITYDNLLRKLSDGSNRNRNRAFLNGLRTYLGRQLHDDARDDLTEGGGAERYLMSVGHSPNRRSVLKHVRTLVADLPPDPFGDVLARTVLEWRKNGGTTRTLAQHIGIPETLLSSYLCSRKIPGKSLKQPLINMEALFGYEPGTLTQYHREMEQY